MLVCLDCFYLNLLIISRTLIIIKKYIMTVNFPHVKTLCSSPCYEYARIETIRLLTESNAAFAIILPPLHRL